MDIRESSGIYSDTLMKTFEKFTTGFELLTGKKSFSHVGRHCFSFEESAGRRHILLRNPTDKEFQGYSAVIQTEWCPVRDVAYMAKLEKGIDEFRGSDERKTSWLPVGKGSLKFPRITDLCEFILKLIEVAPYASYHPRIVVDAFLEGLTVFEPHHADEYLAGWAGADEFSIRQLRSVILASNANAPANVKSGIVNLLKEPDMGKFFLALSKGRALRDKIATFLEKNPESAVDQAAEDVWDADDVEEEQSLPESSTPTTLARASTPAVPRSTPTSEVNSRFDNVAAQYTDGGYQRR